MSNFFHIDNELNRGIYINLENVCAIAFNAPTGNLTKTFFHFGAKNTLDFNLTPKGVKDLIKAIGGDTK